MGVSDGFLWVSNHFGRFGLPAPFLCFSLAKNTQAVGLPFQHLGKKQQGAAGLGIRMLVPEVKQLRGEDGRGKESQEEKATYGQVLRILPRGAAGEKSPPEPTSQMGKLRQGQVGWEMGREITLVRQDGFFSLDLSFLPWKAEEQYRPSTASPVLRAQPREGSTIIIPRSRMRKQTFRDTK